MPAGDGNCFLCAPISAGNQFHAAACRTADCNRNRTATNDHRQEIGSSSPGELRQTDAVTGISPGSFAVPFRLSRTPAPAAHMSARIASGQYRATGEAVCAFMPRLPLRDPCNPVLKPAGPRRARERR